jgi:hypothetical protein
LIGPVAATRERPSSHTALRMDGYRSLLKREGRNSDRARSGLYASPTAAAVDTRAVGWNTIAAAAMLLIPALLPARLAQSQRGGSGL